MGLDYGDGLPSSQRVFGLETGSFMGFATGSFTGWHPYSKLGRTGYLTATDKFKQPLCGNEEGWGPLSPIRYDFTPCFIDVWVATVAAFGLAAGSLAIWWLLKRRKPTAVSKDWHFWTKQVGRICA